MRSKQSYTHRSHSSAPHATRESIILPLGIRIILLTNAFTGTDSTLATFNFGKNQMLKKVTELEDIWNKATIFYSDDVSPQDIGAANMLVFESIF